MLAKEAEELVAQFFGVPVKGPAVSFFVRCLLVHVCFAGLKRLALAWSSVLAFQSRAECVGCRPVQGLYVSLFQFFQDANHEKPRFEVA